MGNADLRDIAVIEQIDQGELAGDVVAVDAPNWLYKYMTTTARFIDTDDYTTTEGKELSNLIGVPRGLRKFFEYDVTPVFVFDGSAHTLKSDEIEERREARESAAEKAESSTDKIETARYQARAQHLNTEIIESTQEIFDHLDIPYMVAPQAAEAQTARMAETDMFDSAITEDYDSLLFGCPQTIRQFTSSDDTVERMSFPKTLSEHDITQDQLITTAILCGTDYNDGVSGIGPKTGLKLVSEHRTVEGVLRSIDGTIDNVEEIHQLFTDASTTNEWPSPDRPTPDVEATEDYLDGLGIDVSHVDTALTEIRENSSQTGLNSF